MRQKGPEPLESRTYRLLWAGRKNEEIGGRPIAETVTNSPTGLAFILRSGQRASEACSIDSCLPGSPGFCLGTHLADIVASCKAPTWSNPCRAPSVASVWSAPISCCVRRVERRPIEPAGTRLLAAACMPADRPRPSNRHSPFSGPTLLFRSVGMRPQPRRIGPESWGR